MKIATLEELLVDELRDLYDAEKQLVRALPKMAKAATYPELRDAFKEHLEVTKGQVGRLEQVFELLGQRARSKPCKAMKGLVEEGQEIMGEDYEDTLLDEALIGAGQKVEHYEIAGYGTARTLAQMLGRKDASELLRQTLTEEGETDKKLTAISKKLLKESVQQLKKGAANGDGQPRPGQASRTNGSTSRHAAPARATASKSAPAATHRRAVKHKNGPTTAQSYILTDHDEIREWAESRGAHPSCVRGTGDKGETGMIRLDFPGYSGETSLQPIEWDQWFDKFDQNKLALLVQEKTSRGQKSNFNKLVSRETAQEISG